MKTLLIILILPCVVWAGSADFTPDASVTEGADWTGCDSTNFYSCITDDIDAQYLDHYDNNNMSEVIFSFTDNGGTIDTTIDSVTFYFRWQTSHTNNSFVFTDSIPDVGRQSSTFSSATTDTWFTDSVTYSEAPNTDPWSWDEHIDNVMAGLLVTAKANNQDLLFTEMWLTVWWTTPSTGGDISYVRRRNIIQGSQ